MHCLIWIRISLRHHENHLHYHPEYQKHLHEDQKQPHQQKIVTSSTKPSTLYINIQKFWTYLSYLVTLHVPMFVMIAGCLWIAYVYYFPTCQVRVGRILSQHLSFSFSSSSFSLLLLLHLFRDPVSSVWRAGPQPRSCEFSVACRTSTTIL